MASDGQVGKEGVLDESRGLHSRTRKDASIVSEHDACVASVANSKGMHAILLNRLPAKGRKVDAQLGMLLLCLHAFGHGEVERWQDRRRKNRFDVRSMPG